MTLNVLPAVLFRLVLPVILLGAALFRYNGMSFVYLVCLLFIPLIPSPSRRGSKAAVRLQSAILISSVTFILCHIIFQVVLLAYSPYGHFVKLCSNPSMITQQIGFHKYNDSEVSDIIRLLLPDVVVFASSLIAVLSSRSIEQRTSGDHVSSVTPQQQSRHIMRLVKILPFLVGLMLLLAGIMQPNVFSSVYFVIFIVLGVCWAFHLLEHVIKNTSFILTKIILTVYAGLHVLVLYLYQFPFFQEVLVPNSFLPRLLGLPAIIVNTDCKKGRQLVLNTELPWPFYVYPFSIFLLYWVLAADNRLRSKKNSCDPLTCKPNPPWWSPQSWSVASKESTILLDNSQASQYGAIDQADMPTVNMSIQERIQVQGMFSSVMIFLTHQSYIAALIIMMAWSITYHSWLTFVLLLWACMTWITPFARWFCMVSSPYLVVYAELLLVLQYIYGIDLKDDELPVKEGNFDFAELGLIRSNYAVVHLGLQTLFTWVFLVTLRQYFSEKKMQRHASSGSMREALALTTITKPIFEAIRRTVSTKFSSVESNADEIEGTPSNDAKELMAMMKKLLAKYWILLCCLAFLLVVLQNTVSLHQIFYMVIFLFGFIVYQFSVSTWKTILRPLWWFMVIYSVIILLAIYTFQFDNIHASWVNGTHLSEQWLFDIGLHQQGKSELLLELLIPTIFSIVIVIQLHFFHKPLTMHITRLLRYRKSKQRQERRNRIDGGGAGAGDTNTVSTDVTTSMASNVTASSLGSASDESDDEPEYTIMVKLRKAYFQMTVVLWRLAEINSPKLVSLVVMLVAVQQVSAVNAFLIVLLAISMLSDGVHRFMNYITIVWASIVVLVIMFYQLSFVKEEDIFLYNCTTDGNKSLPVPSNSSHFASDAYWLGLHKSDGVALDLRGYLSIVLLIVFEKVIKHHQELYRFRKHLESPPHGFLFPDVGRAMADTNIVNCVKYLCNNFFNLFGLELNLMMMVIAVCIRGDAVAVLHSLWICMLLFLRKKYIVKFWTCYVVYMAVMIPAQYFLILGWPPGWCHGYPWTDAFGEKSAGLIQWFYLTDVKHPQNQNVLLADFFQLLFASCQSNAFKHEANIKAAGGRDDYNPPDFMGNKTWLDFIKIALLDQFLWLTLSIVYITAQSTTSLFNSGFIVGCFFFLWHGQGLYLRPRQTMKRWWKLFLSYIFFVILCKLWLQLVSCVYISEVFNTTGCYIIQLLNLYCIRPDTYDIPYEIDEGCVTENDPGLFLDTMCFICVLIQYRIFKSTYFKYVIREHRRQAEMASRGAELVEERLQKRLFQSIETNKKKMQYIRNKVEKLKEKLEESNPNLQEPLSHYEAIYSGDYNMYDLSDDDDDDDDVNEIAATHDITITPPQQTSEKHPPQQDDAGTGEQPAPAADADDNVENTTTVKDYDENLPGVRRRSQKQKETTLTMSLDPTLDLQLDDSTMAAAAIDTEQKEAAMRADPSATADSVSSAENSERESSLKEKSHKYAAAVKTLIEDVANVAIKFFDETSSDYQHIASQLRHERKERAKAILEEPSKILSNNAAGTPAATTPVDDDKEASIQCSKSKEEISETHDTWSIIHSEADCQESWKKQDSVTVRFFVAFYYALLANTNLLCYSMMIINHIYYACILSMPLPFFVFLWGMLSIPRPTKRFWIAVITYVELVIVVKYVFQFQFPKEGKLNFNECEFYEDVKTDENNPLCPPRIIGIERNQMSSIFDLLLLLCLFFHRFALKTHGLWREKAWSDEELSPRSPQRGFTDAPLPDTFIPEEVPLNPTQLPQKRGIWSNIFQFIVRMLDPQIGTGAVDVYAWMFGAQFIIFIIILSSWSAFSSTEEGSSNFAKIIEQNTVPRTFLYMLLTQFLIIVLDRYMYMRKLVLPKLIYLTILVFVLHIFLFVVVPDLTKRAFVFNVPAVFLYLFLCIYFGLSAYQVRCGYPIRILGNFLTKNYTVTSAILFQGFQVIPFVLELRSVLDWVCTKTTLTLNHWLKMEDIYANIFITKCWRDSEKTRPQPRGLAYSKISKWLIGGILVVLLIVVIWFPLLLMSFISSAYISNRPIEVTFTLTIGGYQPLFKVASQQQFLNDISADELDKIVKLRAGTEKWDPVKIQQELHNYKKSGNVISIKVLSNSSAIWTISPPSREFLINDLESNSSISLQFKYVFDRKTNTTQAAIVKESVSGAVLRQLPAGDPIRKGFAAILRNPSGDGNITIPKLFPSFVRVPASGAVDPVSWLPIKNDVSCTVILRRGNIPHTNTTAEWWEIIQDSPKPVFSRGAGHIEMIALNDLVPPLHLSFFASSGIIGLYVGFVWLIGKFVRIFFTSISYRIMYDELPNVDRLLKLILEIYMVRESKELKLEEDLFAKLLFLYRSPETMIKWTKYKKLKTS